MAITKPSRSMLSTGISDSSDATFLTADSSENATFAGNLTVSGNLTVTGTTTQVDTVTMNAQNAVLFEGATADSHETTLTTVDPTGDRTISLPNVSGTLPVLAAASVTQITSTPEELNILDGVTATAAELNIMDGGTSATSITVADADRFVLNDNGTMLQVAASVVKSYMGGAAADDISTGDAAVTIGTSSGAITLDTPSSITLDSDSGVIDFDDDGTNIGRFENSSSDFKIESRVQDKDLVFVGNDGGTGVTALTLDMSDAGTASFNHDISLKDDAVIDLGDATEDFQIYHIGGSINVIRGNAGLVLQSDDTSYGIQMGSHSGGETMFKAVKNGAVTLYYDNLDKLITTDKGILVNSDGSKDVTIGMSNGDVDWHIGIDDSAGDHFKLGKHSGMGNACVYSVTPAYKHRFEGAHQGDSVGTFVFDNENLGDGTSTNCTLMVKNGNAQIQIMGWSTLGARIGTRGGGWSSNSNNAVHLTSNDAGNIILNTNGSPTLANGTAISSDRRLKKNITDISGGQLDKILSLRPRIFEWKDERKTGVQEGFIAQEVESVMPEAVEERLCSPDPDDTSRDFEGDIKVLKHEVMNARLIKAVQELNEKLGSKDDTIAALEKRIETIEQRLI